LKEELAPTVLPIGGVKKTRWHYIRGPKDTLNWWPQQCLTQTQWLVVLQNNSKHKKTLLFKTLFQVGIQTFDVLCDIIPDHEWYDPEATDLFGCQCHCVELLLLGCLHVLGHDATEKFCE
jgi:hypothetical protein